MLWIVALLAIRIPDSTPLVKQCCFQTPGEGGKQARNALNPFLGALSRGTLQKEGNILPSG
jgi:hypothetical protein